MKKHIEVEAFRRKLIDEKGFYPSIVARALDEMPAADIERVVRCKECNKFMEYSDEYKKVEGADGDCFLRLTHSIDKQYCAVKYDDFCSSGERGNT